MALQIRNLSVLAYAQGFTLWHYKAGDDGLAAVERLNYFQDASEMLANGDMMLVSAKGGGAIRSVVSAKGGPLWLTAVT